MFASVIVGVAPGAEAARAAAAAATVARAAGCPLVLTHVVPPSGTPDDAWLRELAASVCAPTVRTASVHAVDGAAGLLEEQDAHRDSLLCVGSRGRVGLAEVLLGSTTAEVLRRSRRPLLVVGPAAAVPKQIRTIVVGYDGTEASSAAATTAAVWALLLTASLHVVRVTSPSIAPGVEAQIAARDELQRELAVGLSVHPTWEVVQHVDPAAALLEYARSVDASVLVLGHDDHRLAGRMLGTTAAVVVRESPCPVLVARRPRRRVEEGSRCS